MCLPLVYPESSDRQPGIAISIRNRREGFRRFTVCTEHLH